MPILVFAKGLFYTATLTSDLYRTVPIASIGSDHPHDHARGGPEETATGRSLGHIAEYVGAAIYLTHPNQALVMRAGQKGPELLRLEREEGATYDITIENCDTPQAPAGSDFGYYYDAIKLNKGEPRILIEAYGLPSLGGGMFPPCGPVGLGKSDGLALK
jgi:hypothetical protein